MARNVFVIVLTDTEGFQWETRLAPETPVISNDEFFHVARKIWDLLGSIGKVHGYFERQENG